MPAQPTLASAELLRDLWRSFSRAKRRRVASGSGGGVCHGRISRRADLRWGLRWVLMTSVFKQFFTNNFLAKVVSVLLATLLWAVIKQRPMSEQTPAHQKAPEPSVNFGAGVNGK